MPAILIDPKDQKQGSTWLSKISLNNKLILSENGKFTACCFMWYLCSSLSSNTGKHIMNSFKYPVTLTFIQFLLVAFWCVVMENVARSTGIRKPTRQIVQTMIPLSIFMIVGHVFSSISISRIPVSLVHTIKVIPERYRQCTDPRLGTSTTLYRIIL